METSIKKIFHKFKIFLEYTKNIIYFILYSIFRILISALLIAESALYFYPIKVEEPKEVIEKPIEMPEEIIKEPEIDILEEEPIESDPEPSSSEIDIYVEVQTKPISFGDHLTKSGGVYYNTETGFRETWYSQRVLPGGGLKIPGRHVDERGIICDEDGYVCVASQDLEKGTLVNTSLGMAKVYDYCGIPGTIDIYVDW